MSKNKTRTSNGFLDFPLYTIQDNGLSEFEISGEGKKAIIILSKGENVKKQQEFITAVLSPLDIKTQDIFLLNTTGKQKVSFTELRRNYDFNTLIVFGLSPLDIGLQILTSSYQSIQLMQKSILFVDAVQTFIDEKEKGGGRPKAKQLWLSLKALFSPIIKSQ